MGRLTRWRGLVALGARTTWFRLTSGRRQTVLSVVGVAVSVGLLLAVTSVGIGLATGGAATDANTDYIVLPEGSASSVVAPVEGQRLGQVHDAAARMERIEGVDAATPLLVSFARIDRGEESTHVLVFGVVPESGLTVAGLPLDGLEPGDPMYDGGPRTGEVLLSTGASEELDLDTGGSLTLATGAKDANRTFDVVGVAPPQRAGIGQLPVVIVHLAELQAITGATDGDTADRIIVEATATGDVRDRLASVYPGTEVLTDEELRRQRVRDSELTLAVAGVALLVALVVGTLFIATTMGFELAASSDRRAVMDAVGISRSSRVLVVATQTFAVCLLGSVGGILLWLVAVPVMNLGVGLLLDAGAVATIEPLLAAYGLAVGLGIGLLTTPYLLVTTGGTPTMEVLRR